MGTAPDPVEPGYTTTEFWFTIVGTFIAQLYALLTVFGVIHWNDSQRGAVFTICQTVTLIVIAAYAVSRGIRKKP